MSVPTDLLRAVVMVGILPDGKTVAKLVDEPSVAQQESAAAARSGRYDAVLLAKPYQIRRRP